MVIQRLGETVFSIKTKETEITTGTSPKVGELSLSGPGEYEVGDVQVRGFKDAYLFAAEDLNVLFVNNPTGLEDQVVKAIEAEVDVLLLSVDSDPAHVEGALKTMNDLDAKVTLPTIADDLHPLCKAIGGCPDSTGELKISAKDIGSEERKVVVLNAQSRDRG